jgi:hypothetical protein
VQVREVPDRWINPQPTARTAFIGRALRGPVNVPVAVQSFADFQQVFGGLWQPGPMGYAVEHFFDNGGGEALIVRVVNGARAATLTLPAGPESLMLQALRPGTREFLRAGVDYDNIPAGNTAEFNLTVQRVRTQGTLRIEDQEIFRAISVLPGAERDLRAVLADSDLIRPCGATPTRRPDRTLDPVNGLATAYVSSNSDGDDGGPVTDYDVIGSGTERTGIFALDQAEQFNFLCIPPVSREQDVGLCTLLVAARYCRQRRAILIIDPPGPWHTAEEALRGMRDWHLACEDAVMYFPRILAHDKLRGRFETFAPCGAVAGLLSRCDGSAPNGGAATADEPILRPGYRPNCLVDPQRRARLAALGVNTFQAVRASGQREPRQRTLACGSASQPEWKFLAARRFALFVIDSIERGTRWVAHADPQSDVAGLVEAQVRAFLEQLHHAGGFGGRSAEDAFFVICDARVNPDLGPAAPLFHLLIGFAAERAGEFHAFRITHAPDASTVQAVTLNRLEIDAPQLRNRRFLPR